MLSAESLLMILAAQNLVLITMITKNVECETLLHAWAKPEPITSHKVGSIF